MTTPTPTILGENTVPATDDPVRVLLRAAREGLLDYVGYTSGEQYEVKLAGVARQLPAAEVVPMVERLRSLRRLRAFGVNSRLISIAPDLGPIEISIGRATHLIPGHQACEWVDGYLAGFHRKRARHTGEDTFGAIGKLLADPGVLDQARLIILGLMYGDPGNETSMEELSVRVSRSKKTVIEALAFGGSLAPDLADRMIEAFGRRWRLTAYDPRTGTTQWSGLATDADGRPAAAGLQMPGIARLRMIGEAVTARRLRYVGDASPNRARWAKSFQFAVGMAEYSVPAGSLAGWLAGLEASSR